MVDPGSPPLGVGGLSSGLPRRPLNPFPRAAMYRYRRGPKDARDSSYNAECLGVSEGVSDARRSCTQSNGRVICRVSSGAARHRIYRYFLSTLQARVNPLTGRGRKSNRRCCVRQAMNRRRFRRLVHGVQRKNRAARAGRYCNVTGNGRKGTSTARLPTHPIVIPRVVTRR